MDKTPLAALLICYDRPDLAKQAIVPLLEVDTLYLFVDGGDASQQKDLLRMFHFVKKKRGALRTEIWQPSGNLGQRDGPWRAIQWFLCAEGEGCIIEEDVIVSSEFISLCFDALNTYRTNHAYFCISSAPNHEFIFNATSRWRESKLFLPWGWATWWDRVKDLTIPNSLWETSKQQILTNIDGWHMKLVLNHEFNLLKREPAYCWSFYLHQMMLLESRMSLMPNVKLTCNIGISPTARRTKTGTDSVFSDSLIHELLSLPNTVSPYNRLYERTVEKMKYGTFFKAIWIAIRKFTNKSSHFEGITKVVIKKICKGAEKTIR